MPPSSRTRNKGKERKARQLAKKEENERADARIVWRSFCGSNQCDHGCALMIPDDHPILSFMDQLCVARVLQNWRDLYQTHQHIFANESCKKLAIDILVNIGSNMVLSDIETIWPLYFAQSIMLLEQYNGTDDLGSVINSRVVRSKWRDLQPGITSSRRDCLKFYRKRTSCKCLKKMHLEARTEPKTGTCTHCEEESDRELLHVCSRCMVSQFCSRECQLADWSEHKEFCLYICQCS